MATTRKYEDELETIIENIIDFGWADVPRPRLKRLLGKKRLGMASRRTIKELWEETIEEMPTGKYDLGDLWIFDRKINDRILFVRCPDPEESGYENEVFLSVEAWAGEDE